MPRCALVCSAVLVLTACGAPLDERGLTSELLETDRAFAARSVEAGAANAFREFLADEALQLPDDRPPVAGRDAIVAGLEAAGDGWVLDWEPRAAHLGDGGSMGWTWGEWVLRPVEAEDSELRYGKYLNVWRRGRDGRWQVVVDMGNGSPPPDPEDPPAEAESD